MRTSKLRLAALALVSGITLGGCAYGYDPYGYGGGVSVGYGNYGYGSGYGYVPLVLPIFGLLWLRHWNKRAKAQAAIVPAAGDAAHVGARGHGEDAS